MKVSFSGHETFALRGAWLKKAVDAVQYDPEVFSSDAAIATFGVGKNMVRSIKHWGVLCDAIQLKEGSRKEYQVSELGSLLFGDEGCDPFFEDPATSWLMHWEAVKDVEKATLWHFIFGIYRASNIDHSTLFPELKHWLALKGIHAPSDSTLRRDFQCIVNSYAPKLTKRNAEDSLQCPFSDLGLIVQKEGALYTSQRHNVDLPYLVFGAIVMDFWSRRSPDAKTMSMDVLLRDNGSPGKLLFISEDLAFDLITSLHEDEQVPLLYEDTAGIRQLVRTGEEFSSHSIINRYYLEKLVEMGVYA